MAQGSVCISEQCAQGTSWIFEGWPEKSHGCISPHLHPGDFLGYSYRSKMKRSCALESHPATTGEGTASAPTSFCASIPGKALLQLREYGAWWRTQPHLAPLATSAPGNRAGSGYDTGSGLWLSIPSRFEPGDWHDFGPWQLVPLPRNSWGEHKSETIHPGLGTEKI